MTVFLKNKNTWRVASQESLDAHEVLPGGVYLVQLDLMGYYLEQINSFEFKGKRYGDNTVLTERIWNTFQKRPSTTGVLLEGDKGSGKTLLAKTIAMKGETQGVPTIIVNSPHTGEGFNLLIQNIDQPCIVIFDEFEKVYEDQKLQSQILSLLDGIFNSKKLFVFTVNQVYGVSPYMRNRPGRIFYKIRFSGLSEEFIREFCADVLNDKTKTESVVAVSKTIDSFNFDMLQSLVEEMNRYDENAKDSLKYLNIELENSNDHYLVEEFTLGDKSRKLTKIDSKKVALNFFKPDWSLEVWYYYDDLNVPKSESDQTDEDSLNLSDNSYFSMKEIVSFNNENGTFMFQNEDGDILKVRKEVKKHFNVFDHIF